MQQVYVHENGVTDVGEKATEYTLDGGILVPNDETEPVGVPVLTLPVMVND